MQAAVERQLRAAQQQQDAAAAAAAAAAAPAAPPPRPFLQGACCRRSMSPCRLTPPASDASPLAEWFRGSSLNAAYLVSQATAALHSHAWL